MSAPVSSLNPENFNGQLQGQTTTTGVVTRNDQTNSILTLNIQGQGLVNYNYSGKEQFYGNRAAGDIMQVKQDATTHKIMFLKHIKPTSTPTPTTDTRISFYGDANLVISIFEKLLDKDKFTSYEEAAEYVMHGILYLRNLRQNN